MNIPRAQIHPYPEGRPFVLKDDNDAPVAFAVRLSFDAAGSFDMGEHGHLVAFGNACTHMGCLLVTDAEGPVEYDPAQRRLVCGPCPCHGTSFDLTLRGLVILGPATQHLPQLTIIDQDEHTLRVEPQHGIVDPRDERWPERLEPQEG